MTLAFREVINDKRSYFIDKIQNGLIANELMDFDEYHEISKRYREQFKVCGFEKPTVEEYYEKVTTIREDKSNRWKAGNDIHFVINNRRPNRFQFAPVVKCVTVQKFEIEICPLFQLPDVYVDENLMSGIRLENLAKNDGFDTLEDFFTYFNKDFKGKIIHWTDLKY